MSRGLASSRTSARGPSSTAEGEVQLLGRGVRIRGRVHGVGALRVEGEIEGDVKISGSVEIGEGGTVAGDVSAASVVVEGSVTGDIQSDGTISLRAGARVAGDLRGSEVSLDESASFVGRVDADFELPEGLLDGSFALRGAEPTGRGRRDASSGSRAR